MEMQALNFLLGIIDNILIFNLSNRLLPRRAKGNLATAIAVVLCGVGIYIADSLTLHLKAIISLAQLMVAFCILFRARIYVIASFVTTSLYLLYIIDIIVGNIMTIVFSEQIMEVFYGEFAIRLLACFIIKALNVLVFYAVYKMFVKISFDMPYKNWLLYSIISAVFMLMSMVFMRYYALDEYDKYNSTLFFTLSSVFFIMSLIVMYFFTEICSAFQKEKQLYQLEEGNKYIQDALAIQNQRNADMRKLRHDLNNHLDNALNLIQIGKTYDAGKLLSELTKQVNGIGRALDCSTGNNIIDAIITYKKSFCESKGIAFEYILEPLPEINISIADLSSLFSNLLDNAIEAAEKTENPMVKIKVFVYKAYLTVSVSNTYTGEICAKLQTLKEDKQSHGLGIGIVTDIAKKYDGTFTYNASSGVFQADVMVVF